MICRHLSSRVKRTGAMLPLIAVVMIILIVGAVLSVDVAHMHMVRAELRTATDSAAKAGAEALARTQDPEAAIDAAIRAASLNRVSGEGLELGRDDIVVGSVQETADGSFEFLADVEPFSSVRVVGRRDGSSAQGPVPLLFSPLLGVDSFRPVLAATASSSVIDIALVLDRSGSMQKLDAGGGLSRNQALINAVNAFVDEIEATSPLAAISLSTYSTQATLDQELTDDFGLLRNEIGQLGAQGRTNMRAGLLVGSDTLLASRPFSQQIIVLMTDGNFNDGGTPLPSAQIAADRGQTIHTVSFSAGANQAIMARMAQNGSGEHFHADTATDLTAAFQEIARILPVVLTE